MTSIGSSSYRAASATAVSQRYYIGKSNQGAADLPASGSGSTNIRSDETQIDSRPSSSTVSLGEKLLTLGGEPKRLMDMAKPIDINELSQRHRLVVATDQQRIQE